MNEAKKIKFYRAEISEKFVILENIYGKCFDEIFPVLDDYYFYEALDSLPRLKMFNNTLAVLITKKLELEETKAKKKVKKAKGKAKNVR